MSSYLVLLLSVLLVSTRQFIHSSCLVSSCFVVHSSISLSRLVSSFNFFSLPVLSVSTRRFLRLVLFCQSCQCRPLVCFVDPPPPPPPPVSLCLVPPVLLCQSQLILSRKSCRLASFALSFSSCLVSSICLVKFVLSVSICQSRVFTECCQSPHVLSVSTCQSQLVVPILSCQSPLVLLVSTCQSQFVASVST